MTTLQSVITTIIISAPLLLSRVLKDSGNVYLLGYLTGLIIAVDLIAWFG